MLTLIIGLRSIDMGLTDTSYVYYPRFLKIAQNNFDYIFTLKDYGFQAMTFLFTRTFGTNFKLYTVLFTLPYISAVSFLIYKYSKRPWISYIVFCSLQYFEISFTLMRQIAGMAILCIALYYFIKGKYKTFILFTVMASLFHVACIVFLVLLMFVYLKPKKWMMIPLILSIVLCLIYPQKILGFAYLLYSKDRFTRYKTLNRTQNLTFFFINAVLFAAECFSYRLLEKKKEGKVFFVMSCICLVISPLTMALGEMTRIAYLFGIAHLLIVPDVIDRFEPGNSRVIVCTGMVAVFMLYFLIFLGPQVNIIPYSI